MSSKISRKRGMASFNGGTLDPIYLLLDRTVAAYNTVESLDCLYLPSLYSMSRATC